MHCNSRAFCKIDHERANSYVHNLPSQVSSRDFFILRNLN